MNKEILQQIMVDQRETFNQQRYLIQRDVDLKHFIASNQIVVISGVRRCGKSSLLYLIKEEMSLSESKYCYFNFDDERIHLETALLDQIYNLHIELFEEEPVLFFDEIQNVSGWERFLNRLYEKGLKIFVTGSNARLLSSEIATSLTGRNKVLALYPFSFSEYLRYLKRNVSLKHSTSKQKALLQKDLNGYMEIGGFPLVIKDSDLEILNAYYQDILYRDIISRFRLSQVHELKELGLYLVSNISKRFSYSTLQKVTGIKSLSTLKDYLGYFEQSFLFFYLKKFDFSVKKQVMNPKKVYCIDPAFANRLGFAFSKNAGRLTENIVFLELLRRKQEVYYYQGKNECDFIIKKGMDVTDVIQVTHTLTAENYDREINGLKEAMEKYDLQKGTLIVNDIDTSVEVKESFVRVMYMTQWLLPDSWDKVKNL